MFIADKKREQIKSDLIVKCESCNGVGCSICIKKTYFIDKLAEGNIPVRYWFLKYSEFNGPANVSEATIKYVKSLEENYKEGKGLIYTGQYGTGKTYSICSILKYALINKHSAYYTSLNDLVSYLTDYEYAKAFYKLVSQVDFLAIDEVDSRHFSNSEQAQQYFGSNFERVVRYRTQNNLPILLASNNASLDEVFTGQYKRVVDSLLHNAVTVIPALGKDHRKK